MKPGALFVFFLFRLSIHLAPSFAHQVGLSNVSRSWALDWFSGAHLFLKRFKYIVGCHRSLCLYHMFFIRAQFRLYVALQEFNFQDFLCSC